MFYIFYRYLKEVVKQYKEEKTMALGTAARYKEALKQRHSSGSNSNTAKSKPLAYLEPVPAPKKSMIFSFSSDLCYIFKKSIITKTNYITYYC